MRWVTNHPRTTIGLVGALLMVTGGAAIGHLNVRNLQRIAVIRTQLEDLEQIQGLHHRLEVSLLDEVREQIPVGSFLAEEVRLQVEAALSRERYLDSNTRAGLQQIEALLTGPGLVTRSTLASALELAGNLAEEEARAQRELLADLQADGRRELLLGSAVLAAMAVLAVLLAWFLPKRLLDPLSGLRERIGTLGEGRFEEVPTDGIQPSLLPLFRNYNAMVARMADLEAERKARAATLEEEVRAATRTLASQHRALATAERLAAVGETAAGVAHELRNPLAGILAALENLGREAADEDLSRRFQILTEETRRVVDLLNNYLAAARHEPEPASHTDVTQLAEELVSLVRYQLPSGISFEKELSEPVACFLPRERFRQALLNLVWNAVEALDPGPGTVRVAVRSNGESITVEVTDDGPGFPEEVLRRPIQAFRTSKDHGTGLGLSMVRRTASDLGGTLSLQNRDPKGAQVQLTIPCQANEKG